MKKTSGKTTNYPFHKPEENHPPGKDSTGKIPNLIGKAAKYAGSAKSKKVIFAYFSIVLCLAILKFQMFWKYHMLSSPPELLL